MKKRTIEVFTAGLPVGSTAPTVTRGLFARPIWRRTPRNVSSAGR